MQRIFEILGRIAPHRRFPRVSAVALSTIFNPVVAPLASFSIELIRSAKSNDTSDSRWVITLRAAAVAEQLHGAISTARYFHAPRIVGDVEKIAGIIAITIGEAVEKVVGERWVIPLESAGIFGSLPVGEVQEKERKP